jgi:hypothetical protein
MSIQPPFNGPIKCLDNGETKVVYLRVLGHGEIEMYNQPPPFDMTTFVGNFGISFRFKRIKRGWLLSTFIITFIEEKGEYSCEFKSDNTLGDLLVQYST